MPSALPRLSAILVVAAAFAGHAHACLETRRLDSNDVRIADLVVVGRIVNYEIVPQGQPPYLTDDTAVRSMSRRAGEFLNSQFGYAGKHARFDIVVDEVLAGHSPAIVHAIWDNSTFGEPEVAPVGRQLIALHPTVVRRQSDDQGMRTLLQRSCAPPFILDNSDSKADDIRRVLGAPERNRTTDALSSHWVLAIGAAVAGFGLLRVVLARRRRRRIS